MTADMHGRRAALGRVVTTWRGCCWVEASLESRAAVGATTRKRRLLFASLVAWADAAAAHGIEIRGEVIEVVHVHHGDVPSATRARRSFERLATEGVTIFRQHEEATRLDETSRRTQVDASLVTCEIESAWKARASNGVVVRAHVAIEERFPPRAWR